MSWNVARTRVVTAVTVVAVGVGAAACGSAAPHAPDRAASGRPGSGPAAATSSSGAATSPRIAGGLDFARLGSLTNYRATEDANGVTITVAVHSPTDWSESLGPAGPFLHIAGEQYLKSVDSQGQPVWDKTADDPNAYAISPYPGTVKQFTGYREVAGASIVRGQPCTQAGTAGHRWTISSPHNATLTQSVTACVADGSGALLGFGLAGSGTATAIAGIVDTLTITQVGGVATIPTPSPVS